MVRVVLNWIIQIPHGAARGADEILHRAIFQEGSLKSARTHFAAKTIWLARCAGPNLGDVPITTVELRKAGLRADDAPLGVVGQAVRWHIAADTAAGSLIVCLHIIEH